jgi:hypothetical protein
MTSLSISAQIFLARLKEALVRRLVTTQTDFTNLELAAAVRTGALV